MIIRSGPATAQSGPIRLVALGDSLTAGYGLGPREGFAPRLEAALRARGHDVRVANAGVSGDTAEAGAQRVDWSVPDGTHGVIVELGANDMLRGLDPTRTRAALTRILDRLNERNIPAMLAGMRASPNLGADYVRRFDSIYPDLARERGLVLYPFFLEGVVGDRTLNLQDGIHPTARGIDVVVEKITPSVERFLAEIAARRS
ncbi:arylesterase [Methylopila henanensis]|uniref:Arylesterase n=1 Tax=Methylopila henanensis TaxID=873516 RepID=A0ABW4KCL8_9HYPH